MPIEEQLLPSKKLQPYYTRVTWLYVCRTFKKDAHDREAERTHDRFGISSWPQMLVFDPRTDAQLATPPRHLAGFLATFDRVLAAWRAPDAAQQRSGVALAKELARLRQGLAGDGRARAIRRLHELAAKPDAFGGWLEARELLRDAGALQGAPAPLHDPDHRQVALALEAALRGEAGVDPREHTHLLALVRSSAAPPEVRQRAFAVLDKAKAATSDAITALLTAPNDCLRYAALQSLATRPDPHQCAALVDLVQHAGGAGHPSRNPNVVRIRAVQALAGCGDVTAIDALIPLLTGSPNNSLTRLVPATLGTIAKRLPELRPRILGAFLKAVPAAVDPPQTRAAQTQERLALAMARALAAAASTATGARVPAPGRRWSEQVRTSLVGSLKAQIETGAKGAGR
ncbi:MAG: HEAT repeat domain-containing protein [Planctomycetes bacterium]|nr:HEAT repeat domain-containing protein [Planctomycetota bacterium]